MLLLCISIIEMQHLGNSYDVTASVLSSLKYAISNGCFIEISKFFDPSVLNTLTVLSYQSENTILPSGIMQQPEVVFLNIFIVWCSWRKVFSTDLHKLCGTIISVWLFFLLFRETSHAFLLIIISPYFLTSVTSFCMKAWPWYDNSRSLKLSVLIIETRNSPFSKTFFSSCFIEINASSSGANCWNSSSFLWYSIISLSFSVNNVNNLPICLLSSYSAACNFFIMSSCIMSRWLLIVILVCLISFSIWFFFSDNLLRLFCRLSRIRRIFSVSSANKCSIS